MGKRNRNRRRSSNRASRKSDNFYYFAKQLHHRQTAAIQRITGDESEQMVQRKTYYRGFVRNIPSFANAMELVQFLQDKYATGREPFIKADANPIIRCRLIPGKTGKMQAFRFGTVDFSSIAVFQYFNLHSQRGDVVFHGKQLQIDRDKNRYEIISEDNTLDAYQVLKNFMVEVGNIYSSSNQGEIIPQFISLPNRLNHIEFANSNYKTFALIFITNSKLYKINISFRRIHHYWFEKKSPQSSELMIVFELLHPPLIESRSIPDSVTQDLEWSAAFEIMSLSDKWKRVGDMTEMDVFGRCKFYRITFPSSNQLTYNKAKVWFERLMKNDSIEERIWAHPNIAHASVLHAEYMQAKREYEAFLCAQKLSFSLQYCLSCLISCTKVDGVGHFLNAKECNNSFVAFVKKLTELPEDLAEQILLHLRNDISISYIPDPYQVLLEMLDYRIEEYLPLNRHIPWHEYATEINVNTNILFTRRVDITPLRIIAKPPEPDLSNRVLREFAAYAHRFIRVSFVDEHSHVLNSVDCQEIIDHRIRQMMHSGFVVAGRWYQFLAYSNSQLRGHSCWFYDDQPHHPYDMLISSSTATAGTKTNHTSCPSKEQIRQAIGDLSKITTVSKFGARLGQGFSSSLTSMIITHTKEIPDIERNQFCFTDGVGTITPSLAAKISKRLRLPTNKVIPSAFQIRFGGCKGMLSVKTFLPSAATRSTTQREEEADMIFIRPSMLKFPSKHQALEILSISQTMPMYLNRQIIPLLTSLGIADKAILRLLDTMLTTLQASLANDQSAIDFLHTHRHSMEMLHKVSSHLLPLQDSYDEEEEEEVEEEANEQESELLDSEEDDEDTTATKYALKVSVMNTFVVVHDALSVGFSLRTEPYLQSIFYALGQKLLMDIQCKARIYVPNGICLIGIVDEYNVLKPNEVFVQFHDHITNTKRCIQHQSVAVGRNPSLHPGDIRVLQACSYPCLTYLCDVIVFSAQGDRPQCNMMSGGDLDGDIYFIIYDKQLIPSPDKLVNPMDFAPPPQPSPFVDDLFRLDFLESTMKSIRNMRIGEQTTASGTTSEATKVFTERDMGDFYVNYLLNDNLGRIAYAHVAFADESSLGVKDPNCIELAKLHSLAVDFAKTGVPAIYPLHLIPKRYPDFMEKVNRVSYPSQKVLGKIYRSVKQFRSTHLQSTFIDEWMVNKKKASTKSHHKKILFDENNKKEDGQRCYNRKAKEFSTYSLPCDEDLLYPTKYFTEVSSKQEEIEALFEDASAMMIEYNQALIQLMTQYEIWNEGELLSGCLLSYAKKYNSEKVYDLQQKIHLQMYELLNYYHSLFWEEFEYLVNVTSAEPSEQQGTIDLDEQEIDEQWVKVNMKKQEEGKETSNQRKKKQYLTIDEHMPSSLLQQMFLKASIWYQVCYNNPFDIPKSTSSSHPELLLSFAWIPAKLLIALKEKEKNLLFQTAFLSPGVTTEYTSRF